MSQAAGPGPAPSPAALRPLIEKTATGAHLTLAEARSAADAMMDAQATESQAAALLLALRRNGETADELLGFAQGMRERAVRVPVSGRVIDVCGTGGARVKTFNISTCVGFVVAAAGGKVAKHGNRSSTGSCGSADVLEALGATVAIGPETAAEALDGCGFAFLMAPAYHPATRFVAGVRREIGTRTIFNALGPLTNPARPAGQSTGVFSEDLIPLYLQILGPLGTESAFVFHGTEGIDEVSPAGPTALGSFGPDGAKRRTFGPAEVGMVPVPLDPVRARPPAESAAVLRAVLGGRGPEGVARAVALNAAFGLVVGRCAPDLTSGFRRAEEVLREGSALDRVEQYIRLTSKGGTA